MGAPLSLHICSNGGGYVHVYGAAQSCSEGVSECCECCECSE